MDRGLSITMKSSKKSMTLDDFRFSREGTIRMTEILQGVKEDTSYKWSGTIFS